jgi:hypothetical protein
MPEVEPTDTPRAAARELLLTRRGLLFLSDPQGGASARDLDAVLLELAALGFVASARLRTALELQSTTQLTALRERAIAALAERLGAGQTHTPLFRRFPHGVPHDTRALWFRRVLSHYIQAPDQPCLHCREQGTTHVLRPCEHVVCERCYDGSNYSACPICNRHVDRSSPFFQPSELREPPKQQVRFTLVDLGGDLDAAARELFAEFCARTQALSPADKLDFTRLIDAYADRLLGWLPEQVPLKENLALLLGRAFDRRPIAEVLPVARERLRTATDVLRLIAVYSGADAALQGATVYVQQTRRYVDEPWWEKWAASASAERRRDYEQSTYVAEIPRQVQRFPMAKLRRPLRRALLEILDGFERESLIEDMLRHRSYWVWIGEFLHPGEYAKRYPKVAEAFTFVRKRGPDGAPAGEFRSYYAQIELAAARGDAEAMAALLARRPGELGRRFDHLLRVAGSDSDAAAAALALFCSKVNALSNPVLLTLYSNLPTRARRAERRMFWPKGEVARGVTIADRRPTLPTSTITTATAAITRELLRRFANHPRFATALIDDPLASIIAPFNERTASATAIDLPRGSTLAIPSGKLLRLFLHWCERKGGMTTDLDLSVGFYDDQWNHVGVCSYYQLRCEAGGRTLARSSGDLTSAPYPDGASEFVDVELSAAREAGVRYAVMVVNAYSGDPFDRLERGFAGVMVRDDPEGQHFDPRSVALKFALRGANGIYTPLCVDLARNTLHWLDVYSKGQLALNNVENSNRSITRICPETLDYFASGVRLDMRSLALLHAAARCDRVLLRLEQGGAAICERAADESALEFHARLQAQQGFELLDTLPTFGEQPALALLLRGDLELPADSHVYALIREQLTPNLTAADLLAGPSR